MEDDTLLISRDAGRLLDPPVTSSAIAKLVERGQLHAIRDSSGRRLFRREDVLRLKREREVRRRLQRKKN